jgi:3-oxoacyl-[acyl-carrier protein] reductase
VLLNADTRHRGNRLKDRVAIVTGAGQGIGWGIATCMAKEGAHVVVAEVNEETGEKVAEELKALGSDAMFVKTDVKKKEDIDACVEKTLDKFDYLDIYVHNAGIDRPSFLHRMTLEQWHEVLDVHLTGGFLGMQAASRPMVKQRYGKFITIGSLAWKIGNPGQTNYCAAKGGQVGLTHAAAVELGRYNINVNMIIPGYVQTPLLAHVPEEALDQARKLVTLDGKLGKPEDIGWVAVFLASEDAHYIHGELVQVSAGWGMS